MKKDTRLNVTIPGEYKNRLQETAEERGVSMSKAIREAIAMWCHAKDRDRVEHEAQFQIELLESGRKRR